MSMWLQLGELVVHVTYHVTSHMSVNHVLFLHDKFQSPALSHPLEKMWYGGQSTSNAVPHGYKKFVRVVNVKSLISCKTLGATGYKMSRVQSLHYFVALHLMWCAMYLSCTQVVLLKFHNFGFVLNQTFGLSSNHDRNHVCFQVLHKFHAHAFGSGHFVFRVLEWGSILSGEYISVVPCVTMNLFLFCFWFCPIFEVEVSIYFDHFLISRTSVTRANAGRSGTKNVLALLHTSQRQRFFHVHFVFGPFSSLHRGNTPKFVIRYVSHVSMNQFIIVQNFTRMTLQP